MSDPQVGSEPTPIDGQNSTNRTTTDNDRTLDDLYRSIKSQNDSAKLQKVLLSSSYPLPISLKLQGIQEMLKDDKGRMDIDSMNFAIRKLRREETIDRSPTASNSLVFKYYFSADFARLASEDEPLDLDTCVRNDFVYHRHNAFGQDADLPGHHCEKEVLYIPVVHHGRWSLYAFSISDKKLSIFDPAPERAFNMSYEKLLTVYPTSTSESGVRQLLVATPESQHENSRLKICNALEFVKDNFNLFKNASGKFSSWRYEFNDLNEFRETSSRPATTHPRICSDEDSGFIVFNFMRSWDGQRFINRENIPREPKELRKGFLGYIASFNCNEVYERDNLPDVFGPMEKLKRHAQEVTGCPAWKRTKMDNELLKAVRENNKQEFDKLFNIGRSLDIQKKRQNLRRGATSDGDGILHIAARYGDLELLRAIFAQVYPVPIEGRMQAGRTTGVEEVRVPVLEVEQVQEQQQEQQQQRSVVLQELVELLRSRNHKGETCLHEAVRHGNEQFAQSLILFDQKIMNDVIGTNGSSIFADGITINNVSNKNGPPLVQTVDYEGVSPLYLATTLCRSKIVRIILTYQGTSGQLANQAQIPSQGHPNGTSGTPAPSQDHPNGTSGTPTPALPGPGNMVRERNRIVASFSGPGGKTALHAAVILNEELTKQILDWMTDDVQRVPDLRVMSDNSGNTPLHLVSSVNKGEAIAKLLLSAPTTVTLWDRLKGLMTARSCSQRSAASPAIGSSIGLAQMQSSSSAVASGSGTAVESTCAALKKDSKGWLPIHVAAANGNLGVIKQLINKCPECIESRNGSGQSFLHVAVEKKKRNVVRYVCRRRSLEGILNMTDQDGNTALHLAVQSGNSLMFCYLMGNPKVCLDSENRKGWTPRDVARLSFGPGIRVLMSSRAMIRFHLRLAGAHYGTCRRDVLVDGIAGKFDKEKLSETISKSAGLLAVCAIFILNLSVTTFFNVTKQYLTPTDPNSTAAPGSSRSRMRAFKYLMAADAITFSTSLMAAFCCTFAAYPIMDLPTRFRFLNIAGMCVQASCMGLVAIFILAVHLAFSPVDSHIATMAYVLSVLVFIPQIVIVFSIMFLHAWTLSRRLSRKQVLLLVVVTGVMGAPSIGYLFKKKYLVFGHH